MGGGTREGTAKLQDAFWASVFLTGPQNCRRGAFRPCFSLQCIFTCHRPHAGSASAASGHRTHSSAAKPVCTYWALPHHKPLPQATSDGRPLLWGRDDAAVQEILRTKALSGFAPNPGSRLEGSRPVFSERLKFRAVPGLQTPGRQSL